MAKKSKAEIDQEQAEIDRLEAELAADEADVADDDPAPVADPAPVVTEQPPVDLSPAPQHSGEMIHLEGGGQVEVQHDQFRQFRVQGLRGEYYEHVRETPDGEWVYRPIS